MSEAGEQQLKERPNRPHPEVLHTGVSIDRTNKTATLIENEIQQNGGKISYSRFMEVSLFGPDGYYSSGKAKVGGSEYQSADFSTSPEASEYFGATIGKSTLKVWEAMGKPAKFDIVEMGAGSGTMAKDLLTWARENELEFYEAINYVIVEQGDLIKKQQARISGKSRKGIGQPPPTEEDARDFAKVTWIQGSASNLPLKNIEGVFISNELPDIFPVEIVKKINGQVKQKFVTLENDEWVEKWEELNEDVQSYITEYNITLDEDREEPININAARWQREMDRALKRGAIFTIDYGANGVVARRSNKRTTRTFPEKDLFSEYRHTGNVDITSDVNFAVLRGIAEQDGLTETFIGTQETFLLQNGFGEFVQSIMDEIQQTKSFRKKDDLYRTLSSHRLPVELYGSFVAQVITKKIDFSMHNTEAPVSAAELFDPGVRFNVGKPNTSFLIDHEFDGKPYTKRVVVSDDKGCLSLKDADIDFRSLIGPFSRFIFRDGETIVLDTGDREALKQVTEKSGYIWDLSD